MAPELAVVFAAIALPFAVAGLTPLLVRVFGERTGYVGAAVALASFGLIASQHGETGAVSVPWVPELDVFLRFNVDGWALLFALLASGIGVLVFTYSARYMHGEEHLGRYYGTLLAFMGSILGLAFAGDLVALFLFWELTSLCSFVLIGHHTEDEASRYSARMAMIVTVGAGLFLLVAAVLLANAAAGVEGVGAFDLVAMLDNADAMAAELRDQGLFVPVLALVAVAAGAKSAQVPLHFWLPNAMVAPTPVSAFLHSATMVKVGVYMIGRLRPLLVSAEWTALFATLGLATMTVGAVLAVASTDLKQLLAYSTASHLGLMVAGFGFATYYGAETGTFHLLNHALFKAALFLVAGVVAHETGTRRIEAVGGLWRDLPVTAAITGVAALSMAGIPPFNGFYSKELLFEAAYESALHGGGLRWLFPVTAVVASVFTVLYSLRFLSIFVGDKPRALGAVHRPSVALVAPPAVLAVLAGAIGIRPQMAVDAVVQGAFDATAVSARDVHVGLPTHLSPPVVMSVITIVAGVAAYPFYDRIRRWIDLTNDLRVTPRPGWLYDAWLSWTEAASAWMGGVVQNGLLRTYAAWAVAAASSLTLLGYVAASAPLPVIDGSGVTLPMALVLVVAIVAAVAVTIAPSHVAGVLTLSILGFMVAIFYILASAPDLALTQLVVETLVLLIFLLVLEELPAFYVDARRFVLARDALLSVFVGATAFVTVLVAGRDGDAAPTDLARYYAENAVPEGGGTNIVNVILVDFRGFDTLGEIFVVSIAAISVLVLITMRRRGESP
jgi:multicomponent Na+:H+ antiporter subunit A